jgi:hypothetical protein
MAKPIKVFQFLAAGGVGLTKRKGDRDSCLKSVALFSFIMKKMKCLALLYTSTQSSNLK